MAMAECACVCLGGADTSEGRAPESRSVEQGSESGAFLLTLTLRFRWRKRTRTRSRAGPLHTHVGPASARFRHTHTHTRKAGHTCHATRRAATLPASAGRRSLQKQRPSLDPAAPTPSNMDGEDLYDEFGNYVGPALEGEVRERAVWREREAADGGAPRDSFSFFALPLNLLPPSLLPGRRRRRLRRLRPARRGRRRPLRRRRPGRRRSRRQRPPGGRRGRGRRARARAPAPDRRPRRCRAA